MLPDVSQFEVFPLDDSTPVQNLLTALTCDIVAAHVGHNRVAVEDLPDFIRRVHDTLSQMALPQSEIAPLVPAVSIRASIKPDRVTCLECGKPLKVLKRHLRVEHGLTPEDYRTRWGLSRNHALIAPDYAEYRGVLAKQIGLGGRRKGSEKSEASAESASRPTGAKATSRRSGPARRRKATASPAVALEVEPKREDAVSRKKLALRF